MGHAFNQKPEIPDFSAFFAESELIRSIAKMRANKAGRRHDKALVQNIVVADSRSRSDARPDSIDLICPPRDSWLRPRKKMRKGRSSSQLNAISVEQTIHSLCKRPDNCNKPWVIRLSAFLAKLRSSVLLEGDLRFSDPMVLPQLKNKLKRTYRPLVSYKLLEDRLIISHTARYLRAMLDDTFLPNAYAFRCRGASGRCPTHHDAARDLLEFRRRYPKKKLWVAECDIKGFYDCVHHEVALRALGQSLIRKAKLQGFKDITLDSRAKRVFDEYLRTYTFPGVAQPKCDEWLTLHDRNGTIPWPFDDLSKFYRSPKDERIGIPQGGAISCFIANLVLDKADRALLAVFRKEKVSYFYARYCDDMILVCEERSLCEKAFAAYQRCLKSLRLPFHDPKSAVPYRKQTWESKSKSVYAWSAAKRGSVPWVGFVGYQIRYDGLLRIRPSSIHKELQKQVLLVDDLLRSIAKSKRLRVSKKQAIFRVQQKLISMSVGRRNLGQESRDKSGFCWTAGFQLLREYPTSLRQLKSLDKGRGRQLWRLREKLGKLKAPQKAKRGSGKRLRYYGFPFSYYGQFVGPNSPGMQDDDCTK